MKWIKCPENENYSIFNKLKMNQNKKSIQKTITNRSKLINTFQQVLLRGAESSHRMQAESRVTVYVALWPFLSPNLWRLYPYGESFIGLSDENFMVCFTGK